LGSLGAARLAVVRVRGLRVGVFVALLRDRCVLAMQVVYRSVQMMRGDVPRDRGGYEIVDRLVRSESGADRARRDVARARFHEKQ
jgi:hypothetical protein